MAFVLNLLSFLSSSVRQEIKEKESTNTTMTIDEAPSSHAMESALFSEGIIVRVFSYLEIQDLYHSALTCSFMTNVIFHDKNLYDEAWQGAERGLTKGMTRLPSISSAREHCRLFLPTAAFAKACNESGTVREEGELGVGLPLKLMNVRGVTEESIRTESMSPRDEEAFFTHTRTTTTPERLAEILAGRRSLIDEDLDNVIEPVKKYDHEIFVRVSRQHTNKVVGQGFVHGLQASSWKKSLDLQIFIMRLDDKGLGLIQTDEFRKISIFADELDSRCLVKYAQAFRYTIVCIFKSNLTVHLLRGTGPIDWDSHSHRTMPVVNINFSSQRLGDNSAIKMTVFPSTTRRVIDTPVYRSGRTPLDRHATICNITILRYYFVDSDGDMCVAKIPGLSFEFERDPRIVGRLFGRM
jgi:hypothetical protein